MAITIESIIFFTVTTICPENSHVCGMNGTEQSHSILASPMASSSTLNKIFKAPLN